MYWLTRDNDEDSNYELWGGRPVYHDGVYAYGNCTRWVASAQRDLMS